MKSKNDVINMWANTALKRLPPDTTEIKYGGKAFSVTELLVLRHICENPGVTSVELSNISGRTRGTISLIMKKLNECDMAYFSSDPNHGKRKLIYATDKGCSIAYSHRQQSEEQISIMMDRLQEKYTSDEMQIICSAVCDMLENTPHSF